MDGVHEFDAAKIELEAAAMVQRMDLRRAVFVEPGGDLVIGDHQRAIAPGDVHRIGQVVRHGRGKSG